MLAHGLVGLELGSTRTDSNLAILPKLKMHPPLPKSVDSWRTFSSTDTPVHGGRGSISKHMMLCNRKSLETT